MSLLQRCSPLVEERAQSERGAFITSKEYLSLRQFLMQQLSLICQQPFDAFRPPVTAPVFAFGTDLTMLESINMPYFDDSTGISSAPCLSITPSRAKGTRLPLMAAGSRFHN